VTTQAPPAPPAAEHVLPEGPPFTTVALTAPPVRPIPVGPPQYGPVGWAAIDVAPPWAQIGRYAQAIPSQYPANIPGVQLLQGVECLDPTWQVPSRSNRPIWQNTQQPTNLPGAQRYGKIFSGAQGGVEGAAMANAVAANQIAASGGGPAGQSNIIAAEHLMGSAQY